jgi:HD-GYP domain-containing protein (c-di-GMP phosphodiesterase class II)
MAIKQATLSVMTPESGRPLPPVSMLERCGSLGVPACLFDAHGQFAVAGAPGIPALVDRWIQSGPMLDRLRAAVMGARERGLAMVQVSAFRGCVITVIAHKDGALSAGFTAAVLLAPEAMGEAPFAEGCAAAGLETSAVARAALPLAKFGGSAAELAGKALAAAGVDLQKIHQQEISLEGFTAQLTDSYDTMDLLYSVGRSMREPYQPEQFLTFVCQRLFATMTFGWVAIRFGDDATVAAGLRGLVVVGGQLPTTESTFRTALAPLIGGAAYPQVIEDLAHLSTASRPQVLAQPLICKGKAVGVLATGGKLGDDPDISSYDIQLIEAAAGYINAFSDNVALYEDQHNLFMGTVQALTAAIDAKDRYTFGHSERVAHLASALALQTGMSRVQAERVRIAGLVHDVGKIGVPEAVLCKSGKLSAQEYEAIKKHPEIGHTILRDISLLGDVLPGVLHHHERFDGKGYPHGLVGETIPYMARLLAVADTFDAMSSTRSYRAAMPRARVLDEIEQCAGSQFDPALARAFLALDLTEYDRIVARHASLHLALEA